MAVQNRPSRGAGDASGLRVLLLGPIAASAGDKPIVIASRKGRALLGYLASRPGQDVSRSHLAGLLWGDHAEEQARASLRQTLSEVRAAFDAAGITPLVADKETISLPGASMWVDTGAFERLAAQTSVDDLSAAAGLVRGEFLEGLSTREPPFEHWLLTERQRLRSLACAVSERLAGLHEEGGRIEEAMAAAQAALAMDPLREAVHRTVMRLHAAQGRNEAALVQYERCRRDLFDGLRARPDAQTDELARSIRARRRAMPTQAVDAKAQAPPGKASIAVLALDNLSGDRKHDVLGEAIAEDIIGALSRVSDLFVVSRRSSFAYRDASTGAADIARELGVRYLLFGSIRIAGERIRVLTSLTDTTSGAQVWADRHDGDLADLFAMQDDIARNVALSLQIKLTAGETVRFWQGQTRILGAWAKMVEAEEYWGRYNKVDNAIARRLLREAIALDPTYTGAIAQLGMTHWWDARFNPDIDRDDAIRCADEQIARMQQLDPELGAGFMLRGGVAFLRDRHDEAVMFCERAVAMAPSDFHAVAFLGVMRLYAGQYDGAISNLKAAMRINPHYKPWVTYNFSVANLAAGDLRTGLAAARDYLDQDPGEPYAYVNLAIALSANGQMDEAPTCIAQLRRRFEALTLAEFVASHRFRDRAWLDQLVEWLHAAGLR